ncbi:MAG: nucleotide exchange factor GrpE [Deferribacteraceae bacterium]|nr:nucleotide exchange factor GrpE [Deferribacteraceae bacterium]
MTNNENDKDHIEEMLEEVEAEAAQEVVESIEEAKDAEEPVDLQEKLKEAEYRLLKYAADTENYIRRLNRDTDDKIKYANQSLLSKFLPVLDNFDLTLQHADTSPIEALLEGVKLTHKSMLDTLAKVGLTVITAEIGSNFDPNTQEAIMLTANPELPNNCVTMVLQNGYVLEGRIIRPAKVQVNKL